MLHLAASPLTWCVCGSAAPLSHHGWLQDHTGPSAVCVSPLPLVPEHPRVTVCIVLSLGTGSAKHLYRPAAPRGGAGGGAHTTCPSPHTPAAVSEKAFFFGCCSSLHKQPLNLNWSSLVESRKKSFECLESSSPELNKAETQLMQGNQSCRTLLKAWWVMSWAASITHRYGPFLGVRCIMNWMLIWQISPLLIKSD